MLIEIRIDESVAVRIEDDRGFLVAGGGLSQGHSLEFVPAAESFGQLVLTPDRLARASEPESFIGIRYYLVLAATEATPLNIPLPLSVSVAEAAPEIRITLAAGKVILRWRDPMGRFEPESTSSLSGAPSWTRPSGNSTPAGDERVLALPHDDATRFFRLR